MNREQARKWFQSHMTSDPMVNKAYDMAIKALTSEAVQGEWIDIDNYYRLATCSHCHKVTMFEKWGEDIKPYNYCPNCGAKMVKGGDDE